MQFQDPLPAPMTGKNILDLKKVSKFFDELLYNYNCSGDKQDSSPENHPWLLAKRQKIASKLLPKYLLQLSL